MLVKFVLLALTIYPLVLCFNNHSVLLILEVRSTNIGASLVWRRKNTHPMLRLLFLILAFLLVTWPIATFSPFSLIELMLSLIVIWLLLILLLCVLAR